MTRRGGMVDSGRHTVYIESPPDRVYKDDDMAHPCRFYYGRSSSSSVLQLLSHINVTLCLHDETPIAACPLVTNALIFFNVRRARIYEYWWLLSLHVLHFRILVLVATRIVYLVYALRSTLHYITVRHPFITWLSTNSWKNLLVHSLICSPGLSRTTH